MSGEYQNPYDLSTVYRLRAKLREVAVGDGEGINPYDLNDVARLRGQGRETRVTTDSREKINPYDLNDVHGIGRRKRRPPLMGR